MLGKLRENKRTDMSVPFRFKQFTIGHDRCAMKVGTDGVLLGAWAMLPRHGNRMLDIGTGCGLIALMLAQRFEEAEIVGLEIDAAAAEQANENVLASPWPSRIAIANTSFQEYVAQQSEATRAFDLIVSNPPYFLNHLESPLRQRSAARHQCSLRMDELIAGANQLLAPTGVLSLIIPFDAAEATIELAETQSLSLNRRTNVLPLPGRAPKRSLLSLSRGSVSTPVVDELVVETSRHQYSEKYESLTREFHLKLD